MYSLAMERLNHAPLPGCVVWRIFGRADSGFYCWEAVQAYEQIFPSRLDWNFNSIREFSPNTLPLLLPRRGMPSSRILSGSLAPQSRPSGEGLLDRDA
jgi:hypothetical protein